FTLTNSDVLE
nr:RecName: Full=Unknown protein 2 [Pseudotsuga menziesii]